MASFGTCKKCGKQVMWIRTKSGKNMPVNPKIENYRLGGKERIVLPSGDVVAGTLVSDGAEKDGYGYISHFATCEFAQMFRRKK